jgi:micrococcal nuclease
MSRSGWWRRRTQAQKGMLVLGVAALVIIAAATGAAKDKADSVPVATNSTFLFAADSGTSSTEVPVVSTDSSSTSLLASVVSVSPDEARVASVTDGDTIVVTDSQGAEQEVRLIGIDASESGEKFSQEATDALAEILDGRMVRLEMDVEARDQYDRMLAYIWVDQLLVNAEMLRMGMATLYTVPPNERYFEVLLAAQDEAQATGRGVWGAEGESPLKIVRVEYNPPGDDTLSLNEEYIVFSVLVSGSLAGYSVEDQTGHRYDFADRSYLRGQTVTVHSGKGTETETDLYWGASDAAIWNNDGDTVMVLDSEGHVVTSYGY